MNRSGTDHEPIMKMFLNHNHPLAKTGHFPRDFSHDFRRFRPGCYRPPGGARHRRNCVPAVGMCRPRMGRHLWKCGKKPHEIWVENGTSFVSKPQVSIWETKNYIFWRTKRSCLRLETTDSGIFLLIFSRVLLLSMIIGDRLFIFKWTSVIP